MNSNIEGTVTIPVEYTVYNGTKVYDSLVPIRLKWVKYEGVIQSAYIGHVNYWTCVERNQHNLRIAKQIEENNFYMSVEYFEHCIFFILQTCAPIDIFEDVSYKEIEDTFKLKDITCVNINHDYLNVEDVFFIKELYHPYNATIGVYNFYYIDQPIFSAFIKKNIDLSKYITDLDTSYHATRTIILYGDKAKEIRNKAKEKVISEIEGTPLEENIEWRVPEDVDLNIITDNNYLNIPNLSKVLDIKDKFIKQFS